MSTVIPLILLVIIGALVFLFLYWKKLRDDYSRDTVFTTGLFVVIGSIAGGVGGNLLSKVLMENRVFVPQGTWFWGSVLVSFVFFLFGVRKKKLRFFETFEAYGMGIIVWFAIFASILYWPLSLVLIMFFILYLILNKYYKRFSWYQSGRLFRVNHTGTSFLTAFSCCGIFPNYVILRWKSRFNRFCVGRVFIILCTV